MLRVTVELLLFGDPNAAACKQLANVEIVNVVADRAYAPTRFCVFDENGEKIATGLLGNYPRFAITVRDLVARGVATARAGKEELPARLVTFGIGIE